MTSFPYIERPRWTCALGGALAAAGNLPQTVPILHAGPGCAGNFAWTNNGAAGLAVTGQCLSLSVPSTNLQENEVVFGGLDRLSEEIVHTLEIMEGRLFIILTGCLPEVIGDDVESLVRDFKAKKVPLIHASVPGFLGDSYLGYEELLKTLFREVVKPSAAKDPALVNVWGVPPTLDPFWRGNILGLDELLKLLGLRANFFFGPQATLPGIKNSSKAALNIVVSGLYGRQAAEVFQNIHSTPYVLAPLPFGAGASERFLRLVGRALKIPSRKLSSIIDSAGTAHYTYLEPIVDVYNDMEAQRHALVVGDANYGLALTDFLAEDLGWVPELTVITNDVSSDQQNQLLDFRRQTGGTIPEKLIFEHRASQIKKMAEEIWPASGQKKYYNSRRPIFVAASSLERTLAADLGAAHLSLSYPVANRAILKRGYTGYSGGLSLTEDVVGACVAGR
ncbi:MAG: hypothetical protein LBT47_10390 [Deltaproteobacteria bacterium]|jgi:nitrogenase molybdenum-iron protein beta chain|nr:hypothetical protein [Deltaproteobacteria bacterium]